MTNPIELLNHNVEELLRGRTEGPAHVIDPMLESVISSVDRIPYGQGGALQLTVVCDGAPISGEIIPAWRWIESYGVALVVNLQDAPMKASITTAYSSLGRQIAGFCQTKAYRPAFAHFRGPALVSRGYYADTNVRVRLDSVSAWNVGLLRLR